MLSEGRRGVDNVYSLKEGRHPMYLPRVYLLINCLNRNLDLVS
jgi:hypothetical protein